MGRMQIARAKQTPMESVSGYVADLESLIVDADSTAPWRRRASAALNGQAADFVRQTLPLEARRSHGIFFTSHDIATRLAKRVQGRPGIYYDPACGMGDLLLAVARTLPLNGSAHETINSWGRILGGTDVHEEFVKGAKIRLALLACKRHGQRPPTPLELQSAFPLLRQADALSDASSFATASTVLMNPPYVRAKVGRDINWSSGSVSLAAVFMIKALELLPPGAQCVALLPESLRCGANTKQWRSEVSRLAEVLEVRKVGLFDSSTDIDVFMLHTRQDGTPRSISSRVVKNWRAERRPGALSVSQSFDVHVGKVVPHRDKLVGKRMPYLHAKNVVPWTVCEDFSEYRVHHRDGFQPPFVVIRRTSRVGDKHRAIAAVVTGCEQIAVENHLIVCIPKDGRFESCRQLMKALKRPATDRFLDERMRCRHLTVNSIASIPLPR